MNALSPQVRRDGVRASLFRCLSGRRRIARWSLVACALIALRAGQTDGATAADGTATEAAGSAEWRVSAKDDEIRGLSDGTRLIRRGAADAAKVDREANTLETSDGVVYRATAEGLVIVSKETGGGRDAGGKAGRDGSFFEQVKSLLTLDVAEVDADAQVWVFWGGVALQMGLRVFCVVIVFQVICHWVEVSYSKAIMLRLAVLFVLAGELIIRALPTALWAG